MLGCNDDSELRHAPELPVLAPYSSGRASMASQAAAPRGARAIADTAPAWGDYRTEIVTRRQELLSEIAHQYSRSALSAEEQDYLSRMSSTISSSQSRIDRQHRCIETLHRLRALLSAHQYSPRAYSAQVGDRGISAGQGDVEADFNRGNKGSSCGRKKRLRASAICSRASSGKKWPIEWASLNNTRASHPIPLPAGVGGAKRERGGGDSITPLPAGEGGDGASG